ncbi:hypothetical protein NDU88_003136 [Pleurodeles waltl]|uniref:Uncharacterized protein n=1 Tax=Pleurodeles waltl TaxID=8319 RepID=A0AAV7TNU7_PLEWA|nr:hypothetical protein NDU88_003136 [Pleurodeles waltl]
MIGRFGVVRYGVVKGLTPALGPNLLLRTERLRGPSGKEVVRAVVTSAEERPARVSEAPSPSGLSRFLGSRLGGLFGGLGIERVGACVLLQTVKKKIWIRFKLTSINLNI